MKIILRTPTERGNTVSFFQTHMRCPYHRGTHKVFTRAVIHSYFFSDDLYYFALLFKNLAPWLK